MGAFKQIRDNICGECDGPLRANDGTFHERYIDEAARAYALPICSTCKAKPITTGWPEEDTKRKRKK